VWPIRSSAGKSNVGIPAEESERLAVFGNALREFLDLEPIYQSRSGEIREPTDLERFYVAPVSWDLPRSRARALEAGR
jgi:hypothetical protein